MPESSQPKSDADRRAFPRSPLLIREARTYCGMDVFFGYALNVSRSGLFVSSSKVRRAGELCRIRFTLPGLERHFRCQAEVVWARSYNLRERLSPGFGLKFLDLPAEDAEVIDRWVAQALAEAG